MTRIVISPGEPAGVGPDVLIKLIQKNFPAEIIAVCDPDLLIDRAKQLNLPLTLIDMGSTATIHTPGTLKILPIKLRSDCIPGKLTIANAGYVLEGLTLATDYCLANKADALVTGPIQKSILNDASIAFRGHTEFLAERCHVDDVIMLFVADEMKVALATTHLPLSQVPGSITASGLKQTIRLLNSEMKKRFSLREPRIYVCGLNPHAGEKGHLGREEINIIEPALTELRQDGIQVIGPLPADTIFTEKYLQQADVILGMYHDQVLPVIKYLGFGRAVNVTLGLPIIRTSVDHGTALDVAGTLKADSESLETAVTLAIQLVNYENRLK